MVIKNKFSQTLITNFANQIHDFIIQEPELTKRSKEYIQNLLKNGSFYIALDKKNNINGFIAKEKLVGNFYEIKCWYVIRNKRGTGLSDKLFKFAISNRNHKYIGATFEKDILRKIKKFGFRKGLYFDLPLKVLARFSITREWGSIAKHFFKKRSFIFIKI